VSYTETVSFGSTGTGVTQAANLGDVYTSAQVELVSDSTEDVVFTVQGRAGSGAWQTLSNATTSTGGLVTLTSGAYLFSQLRANVTANGSTSGNVSFIFAGA
jgi:hypothetical protein